MKIHLTIIFLLITPFLFAQVNLVPNPSFEINDTCPNWYGQIYYALQWYAPIYHSTPDYFNSCNPNDTIGTPTNYLGYQQPNNGNAYIGLFSYWPPYINAREYISTSLVDTLESGKKYKTIIYANLANGSVYAVNKLGVYFSKVKIENISIDSMMHFNPQINNAIGLLNDTSKWMIIEGEYVASGGEKFITIGNFSDDANSNVTYVNSLTPYDVDIAYYYLDDVSVELDTTQGVLDAVVDKPEIFIYPNPTTNELTIDYALTDKSYFELFDVIGAKRKAVTLDFGSQTIKIDLTDIDSGLYFYSVVDRKGNRIKTGKLVVIK